jgi:hypothetical protein
MHHSQARCIIKFAGTNRPLLQFVLFGLIMQLQQGCSTTTQPLIVADLAPSVAAVGYVEFYTEHPKPFGKFMYSCHSGIWYINEKGKKRGLGAVGYYAGTTHPGPLKDSERLRVKLAPGEHQFRVGDYEFAGGKRITVTVRPNMVTRVVVNCAFGSAQIFPVGGGAYSGSSTRSYEAKILEPVKMLETNETVKAVQPN